MSVSMLLDELDATGIRLRRDGDALLAHILRGASIDPYRERITMHKPALLAELLLRDQIVTAASAAQDAFDRAMYDALWRRWHALQAQETTA